MEIGSEGVRWMEWIQYGVLCRFFLL